jgi:hypothetical protein
LPGPESHQSNRDRFIWSSSDGRAQDPRELAHRMRDHRAQHRTRDGFVRETFTQPRNDARQTVREFLDRYPNPAYMSEIEHWRELSGGEIEFTMRRLRTAV